MTTNRREFIEHLGATAMLGALPLTSLPPALREFAPPSGANAEQFDFTWTNKLKGKAHKAVFDCAEIESGFGVWRAGMWEGQYHETQGAKPAETQTVLVLRHNAIVLALQSDFWEKNNIAADDKVTHPLTQQGLTANPVLLSSKRNEIPEQFDGFMLPAFMAKGGIVLACNVALQFFAGGLAKKTSITDEEALKRAKAALLPGVILQPSGVFACVKAQEAGCNYVKAS
ncbi:MAG TPA: hypothetical protein VFT29_13375 [Gemmatimonadaceae bacterium]|nr:hypothetical protein [Gemmatimonadaceae bacterium]